MFQLDQADKAILKKINESPMYDFYRIVDVETYDVYDVKEDTLIPANYKCYDVWCRSHPCINCTSNACLHKHREIVKLECLEDKIFWVMSLPFPTMGEHMVLELIKDVTDVLYVNDRYHLVNEPFVDVMSQVEHSAVRDSYTGLLSKRFMQKETEKYLNDQISVCLVLLDLDKFKQVNDTYGHLCGDEVILYVAELLKEHQNADICQVGRVGGDEFLMIFKEPIMEKVTQEIYDMLDLLSTHSFIAKQQVRFQVSASAGIACSCPNDTWEELFNRVDESMYASKSKK